LVSHTPDDGFHEIQLNGKQLVFLFMAATVVSVVIFLCGVLVGRGVRAERGAAEAAITEVPVVDTTQASAASTPMPAPAGSDPRVAAPPPTVDDLSYFNRLEKPDAPAETLKESKEAEKPAPAKAIPAPPRATDAGAVAKQGYAVQLAALNSRSEADAMAKRLSTKGYAAYVVAPPGGTPAVYRVRVGTFPTRREAETIAAKLEKEEQFKPWVTR
jgi:cell division septation protein DedD